MDDLIILEGGGQIEQWRFPDEFAQCPVEECGTQFTVRMDAITHFKKQHAKSAMYCSICDMPITAERSEDSKEHFHEKHPDVDVELNLDELPREVHEVCQGYNIFKKSFCDESDIFNTSII